MEDEEIVKNLKFEEANENGSTTYLTHNFHSYPAKFIPQIPRTTIKLLTKEGDKILDPFCGCGTTLVEARLLNRDAIGIDLNPIAIIVSKAKTTKLVKSQIEHLPDLISKIKKDINRYYNNDKVEIPYEIPNFHNRDHWFQKNVLNELAIIKAHIDLLSDEKLKDYLYAGFSSIIVPFSNQESDTRFAAKNKDIKNFRTFDGFSKKVEAMNKRILDFSNKSYDSKVNVFLADTTNIDFIEDDSVDHIVTSPPYANTYDYYLYHKFRIYWLGFNLDKTRDQEIGSRNRHSSKKEDISTFKDSLSKCMKELQRVLKKGKYAVIVIGDSIIRGKLIRADELMKDVAKKTRFRSIRTISYKLSENSKMFNPTFANKDKLEHIMFFKNEK
jgi:site-specific DNA-methyltransferase (cytosine-N4-specific)